MSKIVAAAEYTDEELLAILREAYVKVLVHGQTYTFQSDGATQTFTRANATELMKHIQLLEKRVATANCGFNSIQVRLGRA